MDFIKLLLLCLMLCLEVNCTSILCEEGFCREYRFKEGCATPAKECRINNATHTGIWLPSPTQCNCCEYCLPFYGKGSHCTTGGPGMGVTVGRCGHGLTCDPETLTCVRMDTKCHKAQDDYDARHLGGQIGALEQRPVCDGKGKYAPFDCVPAHTCFCQSEDGERIFGEKVNLGATTMQIMHCGCSRFNYRITKSISLGLRFPVIGPRCTSDGNYNPIQCMGRTCYCVHRVTGRIREEKSINLDRDPISELPCYNADLDFFPEQSEGKPPFNYTTPCYENMKERIDLIIEGEKDGFNTDFFTTVSGCMPDGTFGSVMKIRNGTKICVDDRGLKIGEYEAQPYTDGFENMDCKCAKTSLLMAASNEKPICCKNAQKTTIEILDGLEVNIKGMERDGQYKEQTHKRVVGYVMAYSLGLYVLFAILYYYVYVGRSQHWLHSLLYASPLLVLPVLVFFIRSTISWYYTWSLNKNKAKLQKLKEEKKKILEEVMNKETYKVAKEILDKYGNPDDESTALKPLIPVKTASNKAIAPAPATPVSIRQKQLTLQSPAPLNRSMNLFAIDNTRTPVYKGPRLPSAQLPCHLPERNRSALDKVVDYLTRGGPKYHMALICSGCYSHNGMVLTEEFDYVSYACAYCGRFNPSRKQRPAAPPLQNVRALMPPGNKTSDHDDDSSSEMNDSDDEERRDDVSNIENMDVSESDMDRPPSSPEVEPKSSTEKKED